MRVRIIENSRLARLMKYNVTIYPFILLLGSEAEARADYALNHEYVHIMQIRRIGFVRFYFTYFLEYAYNILKYRSIDSAYRNISYEREAYAQELLDYKTNRQLLNPLE